MSYVVNDTIRARVYVGATGLVSGAFTKALHLNFSPSANAITITEDALGYYFISFPADAAGVWGLRVDYGDFHYSQHWPVKLHLLNEQADLFNAAKTVGNWLNIIKFYVRNRLRITGTTYEVFQDDGATVFETGTVSTTERTPP